MSKSHDPGFSRSMAMMAAFVIVGVPLVAYLWETLNQFLALNVDTIRLLVAIPVALLIGVVFKILIRTIQKVDSQVGDSPMETDE